MAPDRKPSQKLRSQDGRSSVQNSHKHWIFEGTCGAIFQEAKCFQRILFTTMFHHIWQRKHSYLNKMDFSDTYLMKWSISLPNHNLRSYGGFGRRFMLVDSNLSGKISFDMQFWISPISYEEIQLKKQCLNVFEN